MALQSMTGFSRAQGDHENISWVWEMRSVNGKGLDIRLRLPNGYEAIEVPARKLLSGLFSRGNIQVSLQITQHSTQSVPIVNQEALDALLVASSSIQERVGGDLPSVADLISMRGIVEYSETSATDEEQKARDNALLESLKEAGRSLQSMRLSEGASVVSVLEEQVEQIGILQSQIDNHAARKPEAIRAHLKAQVEKLIEASDSFDEARLHQEAAILAAKADLQEELDRLAAHISAAKDLLSSDGPAGRKLDFLAQEFNRECNTICSKSNSGDVTSLGLDMKLIIEQFREQIQNME